MKLDRSDSPRLKAYMTALSSVRATSPLAEFHQGIVVNVFLLVLLLAPGFPKTIAMALLGLWNIVFIGRAIASRRHWVVICAADRLLVRAFASGTKAPTEETRNDVIELDFREIGSLSIKEVEIIWPRTRPTVVKFLRITLGENAQACVGELSDILLSRCDVDMDQSVVLNGCSLFIQWKIYKPALERFLNRVALLAPSVEIATAESSAIDLRRFWALAEGEQRVLFARVKQLGFGTACLIMLTHYKLISRAQAIAYVACLNMNEDSAEASALNTEQHAD